MKIYLTYGLGIALAGAVLSYIQYFLGYHNDLDKFGTGQVIGSVGGIAITAVGLYLGIRAVRENSPDKSLSYGRGVGAGTLIGVFSGIFGAISYYIYATIVNPEFHELMYERTMADMEAKGVSSSQAEGMEGMMRFFTGPTWATLMVLILSPVFTLIVALIVSAFLKRKPEVQPPAMV